MDMLQTLAEELLDPQNKRLIKLHTGLPVDQQLLLNSFSGEEAFSSLFSFSLEVLSSNARIELKNLLLQQFQLEIETTTATPRYISGYVTTAESIGADEGIAKYRVVLHPWMWFLTRRTNSRIFQDLTVDEIIRRVFEEYGAQASYEFQLRSDLPVLSYSTQLRESDFSYVQRLIERHGLFYWFEQTAEGHKLIISDTSIDLPQLEAQPSIRFHRAQVTEEADSITQWSGSRSFQPSRVSVKTFDYKYPGQDSHVEMHSVLEQGGGGDLEIFDYPGAYEYPGRPEGEKLARQRLELMEANAKVFQGQSNVRALQLGRWFTLEGHYDHQYDTADERQFLVTSISHSGRNNYLQRRGEHAFYQNRFTCIRNHIPFRSSYTVSRPIVHGPQTAIITGPEGEEIFCDQLGRVKAQFHWDRYGQGNDQSSCWLRVATPSAGGGHGFTRLPRVGEEALVEFLDGDPDRPVITGSLYNGQNLPPWGLPDNSTVSGFMSRSTKGGTADNASYLLFEDKLGNERVHLHAERQLNITVEADEQHQVDGSEFEDIRKDKTVQLHEGSYTLNVAQGKIAIIAAQEIALEAGASKITMTKDGAIQVDAKSFTVNADSIDLA